MMDYSSVDDFIADFDFNAPIECLENIQQIPESDVSTPPSNVSAISFNTTDPFAGAVADQDNEDTLVDSAATKSDLNGYLYPDPETLNMGSDWTPLNLPASLPQSLPMASSLPMTPNLPMISSLPLASSLPRGPSIWTPIPPPSTPCIIQPREPSRWVPCAPPKCVTGFGDQSLPTRIVQTSQVPEALRNTKKSLAKDPEDMKAQQKKDEARLALRKRKIEDPNYVPKKGAPYKFPQTEALQQRNAHRRELYQRKQLRLHGKVVVVRPPVRERKELKRAHRRTYYNKRITSDEAYRLDRAEYSKEHMRKKRAIERGDPCEFEDEDESDEMSSDGCESEINPDDGEYRP